MAREDLGKRDPAVCRDLRGDLRDLTQREVRGILTPEVSSLRIALVSPVDGIAGLSFERRTARDSIQ